ncbi:MAG: DUF5682 family protein, partial [Polyangiaceae bacterium]
QSPSPDVPFRMGVYYPLLPYSPEYVAMKEAAAVGARVVFMDLPSRALVKSAAERGIPPPSEGPASIAGGAGEGAAAPSAGESAAKEGAVRDAEGEEERAHERLSWELLATESDFYKRLAEAAGYRSFDECWDALFDVSLRHADTESFRRDMAYFCAAVRATTPRARMEQDGTLAREAHMWSTIERTLRETGTPPERAMVVCGGFHLFLERSPGPDRPLPKGTVYTTLSPYSYLRVSSHTGYGAGNRAPLYYERVFAHLKSDPANAPVAAMVDHVVAVLARGRREGEALSSADAISVTQHARMLASLRGRSAPVLDDIRDALISCCVKGSPQHEGRYLLTAMTTEETGKAVGRVTPALGQLPLVHDFYRSIDDLDLNEHILREGKTKVSLDLRKPEDERRSVLFHRLVQVGVRFAERQSRETSARLFHEEWRLTWAPTKVHETLIENSMYGESIEAAALARLDEELARDSGCAGLVAERLLRAANMDLPGMVMRLEEACGASIDGDTRLGSLAKALTHLVVLERQAARRNLRKDVLDELIARSFGRACFTMPNIANVPPEEHGEVIDGVRMLAEVLLGEKGDDLDRDVFIENARTTLADSKSPRLRGALAGVLTEIRAQSPDELAAEIARFARALPEEMVLCGDFLSGVMDTSRTALMLGADGIVRAIDELLRVASWEQFLMLLPRTRGAFEAVHERSRVALADRVATLYGLQEDEAAAVTKLTTSVGAALKLTEIDARVGEIAKDWDFT